MANKPGIPSWQRAQPTPPSTTKDESPQADPESQQEAPTVVGTKADESASEEPSPETSSLLEQATRFLQDPAIRDATREKKVAFLQSKGIAPEEIDKLLSKPTAEDAPSEVSKASEPSWSKSFQSSQAPQTTPPKPRDIPPIVTYPEFLVQPTTPPPLITTSRLVNTAYIAGGIMATIYGISNYIVTPMAQNLAEARHDFASHTKSKLDELNSRLASAVTSDPAHNPKPAVSDIVDDISEADSDPTELFHRDIGTQTTPTLSRKPSNAELAEPDDKSAVASHEARLKILTSHIKELEATRANDTASSDSLKTKLADLSTYLTELSYQNQYYSGMSGLYGGTYGLPKSKDGKDDHIEALKADIRAVKGVLLSAKNFPAGAQRTGIAGRAGG